VSADKSNRGIVYRCAVCKQEKPRDDLLSKKVSFTTIKPVRTVLSRVVGWVCSSCRESDPIWTSKKYVDSPGMADTKMAEHDE
jgi:hypothetical protein